MHSTAELWAITSYFNPQGFRRRLSNYRVFRRHLGVPLVTIELSFGGGFELGAGDAEVLVQLRGGDVLWQKERLLNLAFQELPPACRKVIAIDCDVVIPCRDWPEQVSRALDRFRVAQPFGEVRHLRADASASDIGTAGATTFRQPALASLLNMGDGARAALARGLERAPEIVTAGLLWAGRREVLECHGFFDACIVGGGDTAFACAALGWFTDVVRLHAMNAAQRHCYLAWAEPLFATVGAQVGHVDCPVYHLWHGPLSRRRAAERHLGLCSLGFDPALDLAPADSGAWRWNSDKPLLHQYVKHYFASRNEDGVDGE